MSYICVIDNNFTNSCNIILSKKIIYNAKLIIKVSKFEASYIFNLIKIYLNNNQFNVTDDIYNDYYYYDSTKIIVAYLTQLKINFTIINPDNYKCSCFNC